MKSSKFKLKAVLVTVIDDKKKQYTSTCSCPACGSQYFTHGKRKNRYVQMTCDSCGRHLEVGLIVLDTLSSH